MLFTSFYRRFLESISIKDESSQNISKPEKRTNKKSKDEHNSKKQVFWTYPH